MPELDGPELNGKVAIVTGAGRLRGIGRGAAVAFARLGADVVVTGTGRNPDRYPPDEKAVGWRDIESTAEQVRAEGHSRPASNCRCRRRHQRAADGRAHHRGVWQNRHPCQQRRIRPRTRPRADPKSPARHLPASVRCEDNRHLSLHQGGHRADDTARRRQDSQHIIRFRPRQAVPTTSPTPPPASRKSA